MKTHTETYKEIRFADPYKICLECEGWVVGYLDAPGPVIVTPCEHDKGYRDVCPSWGPVDGCQCLARLGHVPHGEPPTETKETP